MFKGNWLKENIASVLILWWSVSTVVILIIILTKEVRTDDKTTYLIISMLNSLITFGFGYYYGASKKMAIGDNSSSVTVEKNVSGNEVTTK
jgi:hypothetical protein